MRNILCAHAFEHLGSQLAAPFQKVVDIWRPRTLLVEVGRGRPALVQPSYTFSSVCFLTVDERLLAILSFCYHGFPVLYWTPGNRKPINFPSLKLLFVMHLVMTVRKVTNKVMFRYLHINDSPRHPTVSAVKGRVMLDN